MLYAIKSLLLLISVTVLYISDNIFSLVKYLSGIEAVTIDGEKGSLMEIFLKNRKIATIFNSIFLIAIVVGLVLTVIITLKNITNSNEKITAPISRLLKAMLSVIIMMGAIFMLFFIVDKLISIIYNISFPSNKETLNPGMNLLKDYLSGDIQRTHKIGSEERIKELNDVIVNLQNQNIDIYQAVRKIYGNIEVNNFGIYKNKISGKSILFDKDNSITPENFYFFILLGASISFVVCIFKALIRLSVRIYELIFSYFMMPFAAASMPLDDGMKFSTWRSSFIRKTLSIVSIILSINLYLLIFPLMREIKIENSHLTSILKIFLSISGTLIIPLAQKMFDSYLDVTVKKSSKKKENTKQEKDNEKIQNVQDSIDRIKAKKENQKQAIANGKEKELSNLENSIFRKQNILKPKGGMLGSMIEEKRNRIGKNSKRKEIDAGAFKKIGSKTPTRYSKRNKSNK